MKVLGRVLCSGIAVNFILFVLTFIPAFSGIGPKPGLADRLWDSYRVGGWRADIVWVVASSAVLFLLAVVYAGSPSARQRPPYKLVVTSCAVWLVCFVIYVRYISIHMMG